MTTRELAQRLGVRPVEVALALVESGMPSHLVSFDSEIPVGGYELAVAAHIIKKQDETINRILFRPPLTKQKTYVIVK